MLQFFKNMFAPQVRDEADRPAIPAGQRVYAVGDIHGRSDLFISLIEAIEEDNRAQGEAETLVVLLGDLVDRGPDSANVIGLAREWRSFRNVRILAGNHEEMFLKSFDNEDMLKHFLRHGGRETILSYGVDRRAYSKAPIGEVQEMMRAAVPPEDRKFIENFENMIRTGDYLFVHAGIVPGVPLEEQKASDLRWIREPFLSHAEPHGCMVVHGHTITDAPVCMGNRIGIDTGAYSSGRLTALALEGTTRRYISVRQGEDKSVTVVHEDA